MGYAMVMAPCCVCGNVVGCNPHRVPSIRINGVREPICRDCVEKYNPERIRRGLEPITIHPDAYDGIPEEEL